MTPDEQAAYVALAQSYGPLTDPKYAQHPEKAERQLQEAVRKCWGQRKHFPAWILDYCKRWEAEAKDVRGDQRPVSENHDMAAVRSPDEGR